MVRGWDLADLARRRPVIRNAAALALTAGVARLCDAAYRVAVARLIGPETVGLLQMAGSVYAFAFALATLGLSPAVARLVAAGRAGREGSSGPGQPAEKEREVVAAARALAGPAGLASALLLLAAAPWLARHVLADPRAEAPLRVLAFGLIPAGYCGVLRGRFQGAQRMAPLAWAQILEPAVRLTAILCALLAFPALWSVPLPLPPAALLAAVAVVGEGAECLFLAGWIAREAGPTRRRGQKMERGSLSPAATLQLLHLAVPIMLGQFLLSAVAVADASLIPRLLTASGLPPPLATREYGTLYGMVLPFLFVPMTLVFPLGAVLIPGVAEARAAANFQKLRRRIALAVRATVAIEAGAALLYLAAPGQLAEVVGGGAAVAELIRGLALWVPFAYLDHIGSAALIGLGSARGALLDGLLNAAVRLSLASLLVPHPALRSKGALLALAAGDAAATAAHFLRLNRQLPPMNRRKAL
ncbi:MAG: oligosaccharide flippase family protein [Bacillota bacterium]|nr:oligosaccharide flippase family protein [Bacillota bacterium]